MKEGVFSLALLVAACGPTPGPMGDDDDDPTVDAGEGGFVDGPPSPMADAAPCVQENVTATEAVAPVDIIWVIDNSGSMEEEEDRVQDNINDFSASIAGSGVDYHVILITDAGHIIVPPPLGGGPNFLHVNQKISSNDALEKIISTYPMWQAFLRPNSIKHFVAVTDDESDLSKSQFEAQIAGLTSPGFPDGFVFHAIVAEDPPWDFGSHCFTLAAAVGETYIDLQVAHGGVFFSLCDTDWSPLWPVLSAAVVEGVELPCQYAIPAPPPGQDLDFSRVNFVFTPAGGTPITIPNVGTAAGCGPGGGWYYDDPAAPTTIVTCPATCDALESNPGNMVAVGFGCGTVIDG